MRVDEPELLECEVEIAAKQCTSFSERPATAMSDKFRRKSMEELKREINSQLFPDVTKVSCFRLSVHLDFAF